MGRDSSVDTTSILDQMADIEIADEDTRALESFFARRYSDPDTVTAKLKYQIIHDFVSSMEDMSISKADLARKLHKSRQYVGRVLDDKSNFTLRSIATFAWALDLDISIHTSPRTEKQDDTGSLEVEYSEPETLSGGGYCYPGVKRQFCTELKIAK